MEEKIKNKIKELEEDLDMWIKVNDDLGSNLYNVSEERIKAIRAKINVLKEILED